MVDRDVPRVVALLFCLAIICRTVLQLSAEATKITTATNFAAHNRHSSTLKSVLGQRRLQLPYLPGLGNFDYKEEASTMRTDRMMQNPALRRSVRRSSFSSRQRSKVSGDRDLARQSGNKKCRYVQMDTKSKPPNSDQCHEGGQSCQTKCSDEPREECQSNSGELVCQEVEEEVCDDEGSGDGGDETWLDPYRDRSEKKCEVVEENECKTELEEECQSQPNVECDTVDQEACTTILEPVCTIKTKRNCYKSPKKECKLVSDTSCRYVDEITFEEECTAVEESKCRTVYDEVWETKCQMVNVTMQQRDCSRVPKIVTEMKCEIARENGVTQMCTTVQDQMMDEVCTDPITPAPPTPTTPPPPPEVRTMECFAEMCDTVFDVVPEQMCQPRPDDQICVDKPVIEESVDKQCRTVMVQSVEDTCQTKYVPECHYEDAHHVADPYDSDPDDAYYRQHCNDDYRNARSKRQATVNHRERRDTDMFQFESQRTESRPRRHYSPSRYGQIFPHTSIGFPTPLYATGYETSTHWPVSDIRDSTHTPVYRESDVDCAYMYEAIQKKRRQRAPHYNYAKKKKKVCQNKAETACEKTVVQVPKEFCFELPVAMVTRKEPACMDIPRPDTCQIFNRTVARQECRALPRTVPIPPPPTTPRPIVVAPPVASPDCRFVPRTENREQISDRCRNRILNAKPNYCQVCQEISTPQMSEECRPVDRDIGDIVCEEKEERVALREICIDVDIRLPREECQPVTRQDCRYRPVTHQVEKCEPTVEERCTVDEYHEECVSNCVEECEERDKRVCMSLPQTQCRKSYHTQCDKKPRTVCKKVPRQKCTTFDSHVSRNRDRRPKRRCRKEWKTKCAKREPSLGVKNCSPSSVANNKSNNKRKCREECQTVYWCKVCD